MVEDDEDDYVLIKDLLSEVPEKSFHVEPKLRWIESPARPASLVGLSSRDRAGVCGDYAWLATELSGEEIADVMVQEDYSAAADVLSECSRLATGVVKGGRNASGGVAKYERARQALASKFNGQGAAGS